MQISYNKTTRKEKPKYIVVHTTGNTRRGANARAHFEYWNSGNVGQSADFVVDDKEVLQINDYNKFYTWHCGDGKGKYGITNSNSVGIEICVNSDGDFIKATENALELVRELMGELCIDADHVVRHYDASRKNCPAEMASNDWEAWKDFKKKLTTVKELTTVNDIVWELAERGIITNKNLWLEKLESDVNSYWLARKCVAKLREEG